MNAAFEESCIGKWHLLRSAWDFGITVRIQSVVGPWGLGGSVIGGCAPRMEGKSERAADICQEDLNHEQCD